MKKKLLATILAVSMVATAGVTATACFAFKDKLTSDLAQTDSSIDQVTDEAGGAMDDDVNAMPTRMTFRNARALTNSSEYSSVTIQATIKPDNATNKRVSWSVTFVNQQSTWATGKNVNDYITITPQSAGSNIATIDCLKPFGEQVKITVVSESNRNAKAECVVDFAQRIQKVPFDVQCFEEDYSLMDLDFSMDALYLDVGIGWDLWIDEPNREYTDYTIEDVFDVELLIYSNEEILQELNAATGLNLTTAALAMDRSEGAIYGSLLSALEGENFNIPENYNKLNNWLTENSDKALFTLRYKALGNRSTYESEIPIYINANHLNVLVTEITLNQGNFVI